MKPHKCLSCGKDRGKTSRNPLALCRACATVKAGQRNYPQVWQHYCRSCRRSKVAKDGSLCMSCVGTQAGKRRKPHWTFRTETRADKAQRAPAHSWWATPSVQRDRIAFDAAHGREIPRMTAQGTSTAVNEDA